MFSPLLTLFILPTQHLSVSLTHCTSHIRGYIKNNHYCPSSVFPMAIGFIPVSVSDTMGGGAAGLWNVTLVASG